MANVFISYSRQSESIIKTLADDIKALNHTAWFDRELTGGQAWWEQILSEIRNCDLFIFALTLESLKSIACSRGYSYASELGKPILPIFIDDVVSMKHLPSALSQLQYVDYQKQDRDAVLSLAKSLSNIPYSRPLPSPLPHPPEIPISYIGNLYARVETEGVLSLDEQNYLLADLKGSLRKSDNKNDVIALLKSFRQRRDLCVVIGEEIDEIINANKKYSSSKLDVIQDNYTTTKASKTAQPSRLKCAIIWGFWWSLIGIISVIFVNPYVWFAGFFTGVGVGVSRAIVGTDRKLFRFVFFVAALGWCVCMGYAMSDDYMTLHEANAGSMVIAVPLGAVLGSFIGIIWRKI